MLSDAARKCGATTRQPSDTCCSDHPLCPTACGIARPSVDLSSGPKADIRAGVATTQSTERHFRGRLPVLAALGPGASTRASCACRSTCEDSTVSQSTDSRSWWALPRGHHPAAKQKLTVTDLDGEALVMYAPIESRHPHELVSFPFRVAGIKPNFVQYAREIHTMLALVGGGLGVALVLKTYEAAAHQLEAARLQRTHAGLAQTRRQSGFARLRRTFYTAVPAATSLRRHDARDASCETFLALAKHRERDLYSRLSKAIAELETSEHAHRRVAGRRHRTRNF